ncbi:MAG: hypothetical protein WBE08_08245 [Methyloceanibacter sp.]|jgi:hypothetical protein
MRRNGVFAMVMAACCSLPISVSAQQTHCFSFSGTSDAMIKSNAIEGALTTLSDAIDKWKLENGVSGPVVQTPERPKPHPYWRSSVSPNLFLPPDVVTDTSHTICWKGVVSPVVCTSGAKICW